MPNPRKLQEDKELLGTARNDRPEPNLYQPEPIEELPNPPEYLNKTGRKHWKKYVKVLHNGQKLVENDLNSLGRYCMHLQIAEEAAEELKKGVVRELKDDEGRVYYVETPNLLKIFNEASSHALKFEQQFGFTPAARKNIPASAPLKQKTGLRALMSQPKAEKSVFKIA